jgi:hypothetical protein
VTAGTDRRAVPVASGDIRWLTGLAAAVVLGGGLAGAARAGAVPLLAAVAVVQALLAVCWLFGTAVPGRRVALAVAALAAAGSDVAVSRYPHGRLGALLIVLGLAFTVMVCHQLLRGAARAQVIASLSGVAVLVLAEVALAALVQIRHEFTTPLAPPSAGGTAAAAAVAVPASALVVGYLVDMVVSAPRFDRRVPRGLPAVAASGAVGAAVGYLIQRGVPGFGTGALVFLGAALGLLAGLLAVATAFLEYTTSVKGRWRPAERAVAAAALPLCLLAPVAFLLDTAIRK